VLAGMVAALEFLDGGSLAGRTFAVQGVGHVGEPLIQFLLEHGAEKIYACDVDAGLVGTVQKGLPDCVELRSVGREDEWIYGVDCDVFAPCATGAILNPATIPMLRARVVCGAANNQLDEPHHGELLAEYGIAYMPDYVTNGGGLVSCAAEWYGNDADEVPGRVRQIYNTSLLILERASADGITTADAADRIAEERVKRGRK